MCWTPTPVVHRPLNWNIVVPESLKITILNKDNKTGLIFKRHLFNKKLFNLYFYTHPGQCQVTLLALNRLYCGI